MLAERNHNCSAGKEHFSYFLLFPIKSHFEKQTELSLQESNKHAYRRDINDLVQAYVTYTY